MTTLLRSRDSVPRLALTLGDPRGIGPEVVAKALADPRVQEAFDLRIIGPAGLGLDVHDSIGEWTPDAGAEHAGRLSGLAIERAAKLARTGEVQGIVTAPIDKHAFKAGGYDYPGHTEMLSELAGAQVAMMLASTSTKQPKLRVVLATTHIPLSEVPRAVTREALVKTVTITRRGLRDWYGIANPRIALCALNPHAGDGGRFGREDDDILFPVAREAGIAGPYSADTVFVRAMRGQFDAVIAPYHDVGMTAIKVASFGSAVNVTLGLPFPRTSPDHGTALDIAGRGVADPSSMIAAIFECGRIVTRISSHLMPVDAE